MTESRTALCNLTRKKILPDLEVARGAFHQGNCCFHILDFVVVVVVVVVVVAKRDAVVDNDAFDAQQFVSVQPLELTNAVDCKYSEEAAEMNLEAVLVTMTMTSLVECYL